MLSRDERRLDELSLQLERCYRQAYLEMNAEARRSHLRDARMLERSRQQVTASPPALAWLLGVPVISMAPWALLTSYGYPGLGGAVGVLLFVVLSVGTWSSYRRDK
jgi:hypothetical protein